MSRGQPQKALVERALTQHGFITVDDADQLGVDPVRLRQMARRGTFERISRAVYRFTGAPGTRLDDYVAASLWPRQGARGVLSHETALDVLELCDVNPAHIDITVPRRYRLGGRAVPPRYRLHRRELAPAEQTDYEGIPIVTPTRAILDGIELGLRVGLIRQAIDALRGRQELGPRDEGRLFAALEARPK
jgi:predicted transcriptional regulator of viral defense system